MTRVFYFSAGEMCVMNDSPRAARYELETTVHNVSAGAAGQAAELQQTHAGRGGGGESEVVGAGTKKLTKLFFLNFFGHIPL